MVAIPIAGAALILTGFLLIYLRRKRADKLHILDFSEVKSVNEVIENCTYMQSSHGIGSFALPVEIKGRVVADTPLKSPFADRECVCYASTIIREYETTERYRDKDGKTHTRQVRSSEVISDESRNTRALVDDGTGKLEFIFEGAELHQVQFFSRFETGRKPSRGLTQLQHWNDNDGSTIGFRYEESGIPLGHHLYLFGEANDRKGQLQVSTSQDPNMPFIISTKTEDEIKKGLSREILLMKWGSVASFFVGTGLVIDGVYQMLINSAN